MKTFHELNKFFRKIFDKKKSKNKTNDRISDSVLLIILNKLTINERIYFQSVCKRWKTIIQMSFNLQQILIISDEKYFPLKQIRILSDICADYSKQFVFIADNNTLIINQNFLETFKNVTKICWITKCLESDFNAITKSIGSHCNHQNIESIYLFDISSFLDLKKYFNFFIICLKSNYF